MDFVDKAIRRRARLYQSHIPRPEIIDSFRPDDEGKIEEADRDEAQQRGLTHYTSPRLTPTDKTFLSTSGRFVVLRWTSNGCTAGDVAVAKKLHESRHCAVTRERIAQQFGEKA